MTALEERKQYSGAVEIITPFRGKRPGGFAPAGVEQIPEFDAIYRAALTLAERVFAGLAPFSSDHC
jgi:hypothetical protein